jgi:hypothetical protein
MRIYSPVLLDVLQINGYEKNWIVTRSVMTVS